MIETTTSTTSTKSTKSTTSILRPRVDVERIVTSNGIVLLLSPNHSVPAVSIHAAVLAGSCNESDDKAGLASLVGELVSEGTTQRTSRELAAIVESTGRRLSNSGHEQPSRVPASVRA